MLEAADGGGYTVEMPEQADPRRGKLMMDGQEVATHALMTMHAGMTYSTAWWDMPASLDTASGALLDTAWSVVTTRMDAVRLPREGPWGADRDGARSAWFRYRSGLDMGVGLRTLGRRVVLMTAGGRDSALTAAGTAHCEHFFGSFRRVR